MLVPRAFTNMKKLVVFIVLVLVTICIAAVPKGGDGIVFTEDVSIITPATIPYPLSGKPGGFGDQDIPRVWYFGADGSFYTRAAFVMGGGWVQTPGGDSRGSYGTILPAFDLVSCPEMSLWNDTANPIIGVRLSPAQRDDQWLFVAKNFGHPAATANGLNPKDGSYFFGIDPWGTIRAGAPTWDDPHAAWKHSDMDTSFGRVAPGVWQVGNSIAFPPVLSKNIPNPPAGVVVYFDADLGCLMAKSAVGKCYPLTPNVTR